MWISLLMLALAQDVEPVGKPPSPPLTRTEIGRCSIDTLIKQASHDGSLAIELGSDEAAAAIRLKEPETLDPNPKSSLVSLENALRSHGAAIEHCGRLLAMRTLQDQVVGSQNWDDGIFVPVENVETYPDPNRALIIAFKATKASSGKILEDSATRFPEGSSLRVRAIEGTSIVSFSGRAAELAAQMPWIRTLAEIGDARPPEPPARKNPTPEVELAPDAPDILVIQFDEVSGTPLADLVGYAKGEGRVENVNAPPGFEKPPPVRLYPADLTLAGPSVGDRKIRIVGKIRIQAGEMGALLEDVARAIRLRVRDTGKGIVFVDGSSPRVKDEREVNLADIETWRDRRAQVMVRVPLGHLDKFNANIFMRAFCGEPHFERVHVDGKSNGVLLYGPGHLVARNVDLLRACDRLAQ